MRILMPSWLLLLLLAVPWTSTGPSSTLFKECDAATTLCYAHSSCVAASADGSPKGDGLVKISQAQADTAATSCSTGFRLDFSNDHTWSIGMRLFGEEDQRSASSLVMIAKNVATKSEITMADCTKNIEDDDKPCFKTTNQADISNCQVKVEAKLFERVLEPLADTFFLSYGQSTLCLEGTIDGTKENYCTEPIKFDVFNKDCQTNDLIGTACHANHKSCDPAQQQDNVFTCPDPEKNTIFLDDTFVGIGGELRCTKDVWRSNNMSKWKAGFHIGRMKAAPQCVSLCDDYFVQGIDKAGSKPLMTDGVTRCMQNAQAPIINDKFELGKITCTASKWKTADEKLIEQTNGFVKIGCADFNDQFMTSNCSAVLHTTKDSCARFKDKKHTGGSLQCDLTEEAQVMYKGVGYFLISPDVINKQWKNNMGNVIGPIEPNEKPYCVFKCSDVFVDLKCDEKPTCSLAKFNGGTDAADSYRSYKSSLECADADSVLIINSKEHADSAIQCEEGVWKLGDAGDISVGDFMQSKEKPVRAHCHNNCHESLILSDCEKEKQDPGCKSAKIKEDKSLYCEDADFVLEASAKNWKDQTSEILKSDVYVKLQCTKQGWIGDGKSILDFAKYPQNDITVNCRSKCSPKFVSCFSGRCPSTSNAELKCENDGTLYVNNQPVMEDLKCDQTKGWQEATSGKLIVDFTSEKFKVKARCEDSCTYALISCDCKGHEGCVKPSLDNRKLTCKEGTVMRVNGQFEYGHLTCSKAAWTKTYPAAPAIPRKTPNEKINVTCLSKCDRSFIKPSPCVADKSCDKFSFATDGKLTCANAKNFIVLNSIISASPFTCDPLAGWSNNEGGKAADFGKDQLRLEANCFRNCDASRIENVCNGGKDCAQFTYTKDTLSCPAGYVLNINDKDVFDNVQCEEGGFKAKSESSFLLAFTAANTQEKIRATCVSKCAANYVKLTCDEQPCTIPILTDAELKCAEPHDLLVLGSTPIHSSSLHCDPLSGWKEGETVVHALTGSDVRVNATCRQLICAVLSPLDTSCTGLHVTCVEKLLDDSKEAASKPVNCPTPNQLYHESSPGQWEPATALTCKRDGQWEMEGRDGARKGVAKGERMICASGDPMATTTTTTTTSTTTTTTASSEAETTTTEKKEEPSPDKPCIGCRQSLQLSSCNECSSMDDMSFHTGAAVNEGEEAECEARSSSNEFYLGPGRHISGKLHCKFEDGKYVWRTASGDEIAEFAALRGPQSASMLGGAGPRKGYLAGIVILILGGLIGTVLLVAWFRKRQAQKREAAKVRGLEQKNDDIIDAIDVDSPKTLRL